MSKKKKIVSLLPSLLQIKAISNIEIDDNDVKFLNGAKPAEGDLIMGDFVYDGLNYSFLDGCSSELGIHRLSCNFTFETKGNPKQTQIDKHVNNFNLYRIGIKAGFISLDKEKLKIQFAIDFLTYGDDIFLSKDRIINSLYLLESASEYFWSSAKDIMKDK